MFGANGFAVHIPEGNVRLHNCQFFVPESRTNYRCAVAANRQEEDFRDGHPMARARGSGRIGGGKTR